MGYRESGSDAGNQKHISTDEIVYNELASLPGALLAKPQDQYLLHLEDINTAKANKDVLVAENILPNVAIYNDGRQRSWEMKNGSVNKIVHADGQVWTRKDKKHWNISYQGKLIGKNVEMFNVKIDKDKTLTWNIGGIKKSISATGEYHDPTLKAHANDKKDAHANHDKKTAEDKHKFTENKLDPDKEPVAKVELHHVTGHQVEHTHTGMASWYGPRFHGKKTSSGEIYNKYAMTCAHKEYPFGTKLLVTNLKNHKSGIVKVTDRGPFHGNRVLDLSQGAAAKLDMIRSGVVEVSYRKL